MASVRAWHGPTTQAADCLNCGQRSPSDDPPSARAWARRHAAKNPGHTVHAVLERTLAFRSEAQS